MKQEFGVWARLAALLCVAVVGCTFGGDNIIGGSSGDGSFVPADSVDAAEVEYVVIYNGNNPFSPTDPLGTGGTQTTGGTRPPGSAPSGTIQFSSSAYSAAEGTSSVQIIIMRGGGASGRISVQLNTGESSASAGSDYTAASGTATWPNGDSTPKVFNIPIIDDTLVEGPETFFVSLGSPGGGATLGAPSTATVTIADNDVATGPCGATANAWAGNAGTYSCSGQCDGLPASQTLAVNGDLVTISPHHAGGAATFQGCTNSLTSQAGNLTYFGQANHRNTITRSSNNAFSTNVVSSGGGTCFFSCNR